MSEYYTKTLRQSNMILYCKSFKVLPKKSCNKILHVKINLSIELLRRQIEN